MSNWLTDPQHLQRGLQLGKVGVWRWQIGTDELDWTENLQNVHQMKPGSFDRTLASFRRDLHPDDTEHVWNAISRCIETAEPYAVVYRSASTSNEQPLWIEARGGIVTGESGERYLTGVCHDVTHRINNEVELSRRLHQQEEIQRLSSYALGPVSLGNILQHAVETAARIFDVPLAKVLQFVDNADQLKLVAGVGWKPGLVGMASVGTDHDSQAGFTLKSSAPVIVTDLGTETRFSGPPLLNEHNVRSGMSVVITGCSDRPFGVLGIHSQDLRCFDEHDISAMISLNIVAQSARQHEASRQQRLNLREMAHRAGNLLQIVSSLATQTFRSHADRDVALQSFASRLNSLSRANYLITTGGWGPTRLSSLVDEVLAAFRDRLQIQGRDVLLPAELAFDLALVLNELATNSIKYGSLSNAQGTVDLSWRISTSAGGSSLALEWCDTQQVATQASGTGFGSKLKRALIEQKWRGTLSTTSEGPYRFSCNIPLPDANQSQDGSRSQFGVSDNIDLLNPRRTPIDRVPTTTDQRI